jgi:signal transduction histidine kinase
MRLRSLRGRLLTGAVLWTIGLFMATVLLSTWLMFRYAVLPRFFHGISHSHSHVVITLALLCLVGGLLLFRSGVSPLQHLRRKLTDVREGRARHIDGRYPAEVQPLVDDLNALLDHRERAMTRAIARAGDLAHGLKTPLAVLAQEADHAQAADRPEIALAIRQQVERMRRQMDYHLAQARAAASGATAGASCAVTESADGLVRTLQQLYSDRGLTIQSRVPPEHAVRCQREDLDEMLGNLLDNACKWAKSRVSIETVSLDGHLRISVEDDGPGIPASMRQAVLQRGVRADEALPGSGLGLAIVRDLADLYGGTIALDTSPLGGLLARLDLPLPGKATGRPRNIDQPRNV